LAALLSIKSAKGLARMESHYKDSSEYMDRSVSRLINEYNDEIEMEILIYQDHYKVVVTICEEEAPYKDFIGGTDERNARRAARNTLKGLYLEAYDKE
jgi:hypothetical protein